MHPILRLQPRYQNDVKSAYVTTAAILIGKQAKTQASSSSEHNSAIQMSEYFSNLSGPARERYQQKVNPVFPPRSHSSGAPPLLNFLRRCNKNPSPNYYFFFYAAPFRKCTARNVNCTARGTSSRNQHQRRKIHSECGSCWQ